MNFVFAILAIKIAYGARLMNCPRDQVKFEKIIGLRPSNDINGYLLHKQQNLEPVTFECLSKCSSNDDCVSFVIYYNISECYWYNLRVRGDAESENLIDSEVGWFEKICLDANNCHRQWIFERIPGSILVGNDSKTLPNIVTRRECQQHCLEETEISCRSAKFRISNQPNSTETVGICTLSDTDRHQMPNSFRASSYDEEYFENQCSNVTINEFCAYEEYENYIFTHADAKYDQKTKRECEQMCEMTAQFNCRGYSLVPLRRTDANFICLIHSENSKVNGPRSLYSLDGAHYYEKARCLNITVTCTETYITVNYQPELNFHGKMYMRGYSEQLQCFVKGNGMRLVTLKMPLFGNECGIDEAISSNHLNRTLLSGTMILQYNSLIQTQGDRVIKIGCIFSNNGKIILGTGVKFGNSTFLPNKGTTILNSSTVQPTVEMRIVDFYTQNEVSDTQIGQELQLIIEIKPGDGPYDMWASHLIAMTEDGRDSILLLDDSGCPTNLNIFPGLIKVRNNDTRKLTGNFYAFKFTSSSIIRFSIIVQFCPVYCSPNDCANVTSNRKRKREIQPLVIETATGATVKQVNKYPFDNRDTTKMPLEFVLVVRNSKILPDQLVYGENRILVAGYDLVTNEVCIDYSLLIGIIVIWVLTQIILIVCCLLIIRRYKRHYQEENTTQSLEELHKNFGLGFSNLESRRVHWADNSDFT